MARTPGAEGTVELRPASRRPADRAASGTFESRRRPASATQVDVALSRPMAGSEDAMPGRPAVSVLLPTWNAMRFLPEAVESILRQRFEDFECIIVDDGSTDETPRYLRSLRDTRLRVLRNKTNVGVTAALNIGLAACAGRYIARMDADDISLVDRLQTQVRFLEVHHDIGIVGSSRLLIDEGGMPLGTAPAISDDLSIRWKCLLGNPLPHPTVMFRRDLLERHQFRYDLAFRSAQDYELWTRLLPITRAANIETPLLQYRICAMSISRSRKPEQLANHDRIAALANSRLLPTFPLGMREITNLRGRYGGESVRNQNWSTTDLEWLEKLRAMLDAFRTHYAADPAIAQCFNRQHRWIEKFNAPGANCDQCPAAAKTPGDLAALAVTPFFSPPPR